jgi:rRNA maturation endonuclease Nob1|tara:strand:- start:37 stop:150 length:114 start_codon:yes stop_codon:yes gene_type:complete
MVVWKYCETCGKVIDEYEKECSKCGSKIEWEEKEDDK